MSERDLLSEVRKMNGFQTACWADTYASTASRTFAVIDLSKVIFDGDRAVFAGFFTFSASDTSIFASFTCIGALIFIAAHDNGLRFLGYHGDDMLGTDGGAKSATDAAGGIHMGKPVFDAYGFIRTGKGAVTETKTGKTAGFGTAVDHGGGTAGGDSVIGSFF